MSNEKYLPIENYSPNGNQKIEDAVNQLDVDLKKPNKGERVAAPKDLATYSTNNTTIEEEHMKVMREIQDNPYRVPVNSGISNVEAVSAYVEPKAPTFHFPGVADSIKSLNFSSPGLDTTAKQNLAAYYKAMIDVMNGTIGAGDFYQTVAPLLSQIEAFTLNEKDWEALRDATVRTQNYILHYMWSDMQNISKAMDRGFKLYQDTLNRWIDEANKYYNSEDFIPYGTVRRKQLSVYEDGDYLQQHAKYMSDFMGVKVSKTAPAEAFDNGVNRDAQGHITSVNYPSKGLVWIEELD